MITYDVRVHPSTDDLKREDQLAWKIAGVAADKVAVDKDVAEMIVNRIIDNASVAIAAVNRHPVVVGARHGAGPSAHARPAPRCSACRRASAFSPEWAAWANGTAVRELDMHDTFLAADYSHPGDNIPPILAVAQTMGKSGRDLIRGIATGYEIHIDLVRAISLHEHKIDHIAHLCPAQAAGIGTLLGLKPEVIYQAVQQAVHVSFTTRQSRKGEISSWKAYAPAHAGKLAVEAVDRVMRGEGAPSPIYEGEDSVIAWMLDGPKAHYQVPLPAPGEPKRAILDSFTKEHSAEYQSPGADRPGVPHARADRRPRSGREDRDPHQPSHPLRDRHRRQRSAEDGPEGQPRDAGSLDHVYLRRRAAGRALAPRGQLRAETRRAAGYGAAVAQDRDHAKIPSGRAAITRTDPNELAFGGRVEVFLRDGTTLVDEMAVANAHPLGAKPFRREDYIGKFRTLTDGIISAREANRFLEAAQDAATPDGGRTASAERRAAGGHAGGRQAGHFLTSAATGEVDAQRQVR